MLGKKIADKSEKAEGWPWGGNVRIICDELCHFMWNHWSVSADMGFDRRPILIQHRDTCLDREHHVRVFMR